MKGPPASGAATAAALTLGLSAPASMALTYSTGADTIGLVMHNAVTAQHGMQTVARSAVATSCANLISKTVQSG